MRKYAKFIALLLGVALISAVPIAQGSSDATPVQRIASLERKVLALQRQSTALQRSVNNLNGLAECLTFGIVGIDSAGNPGGGEGFLYQNPDQSHSIRTALVVAPEARFIDALIPAINPECLSSSSAFKMKPLGR